MNNINLDINTYTVKELEKLLKLEVPYSDNNVFQKKNLMVKMIQTSTIAETKKEELYIFLDNIYNRLTNNLEKIQDNKYNDVKQYDGNHFVIKNENNNYSSLLENNKKVNKSIIKRTYTIDSLFRRNYDNKDNESHDYTHELPETITKAITMTISSIEIPLTYYNISEELNNNYFKIELKNNNTNIIDNSINIALKTGLYESRYTSDAQVKAANIEREINLRINKTNVPDICNNLTFNIDKTSGVSFFKYDTSGSSLLNNKNININFDVNNDKSKSCKDNFIYQKLGWQLGYRERSITIDSSNAILNADISGRYASILSAGICYINYPRYLYITIDDFQSSSRNYFSIASDSIIAPNIVARINVLSLLEDKTAFKQGASAGDFLYTQKHVREYFGPTDIRKLKIGIIDEYGRPFTLNNMDWSFVVSFECFYN